MKTNTQLKKLKAQVASLKQQVVENAEFKQKIAASLRSYLQANKINIAGLAGNSPDAEQIAKLKLQKKFYENLLRGDRADFKAIAQRIGLSYRKGKVVKSKNTSKPSEPAKPIEPQKFLFNPDAHFERRNGGWTKTVTGLNKSVTNGYSIEGSFTDKDRKSWFTEGKLYLDKGIGGSRKNTKAEYNLFTMNANGEVEIIATAGDTRSWATDLWDDIEKFLKKKKGLSGKQKSYFYTKSFTAKGILSNKEANAQFDKLAPNPAMLDEMKEAGYRLTINTLHGRVKSRDYNKKTKLWVHSEDSQLKYNLFVEKGKALNWTKLQKIAKQYGVDFVEYK